MKDEVKRIKFKFNNETLSELVSYLKEKVSVSPFKNHVYIKGDAIRDQLLKKESNPHDIYIIVDKPQGGISFARWLTFQCDVYDAVKNPINDFKNGNAVFRLTNESKFANIQILCTQTKLEYPIKDESGPMVNYADVMTDSLTCGLTIDALYYNIDDEYLYDFSGTAFNDLENGIIRATDTVNVFKENPSKILYALRVASELGFGIDRFTWANIIENAEKLEDLDVNILRDNLNMILMSKKPSEIFDKMYKCNCLDEILMPLTIMMELVNEPFIGKDSIYEHTMSVVDKVPAVLELRLAALFHDIGKLKCNDDYYLFHEVLSAEIAAKILEGLKYSDETVDTVKTLITHHEDFLTLRSRQSPGNRFIRRFKKELGKNYEMALELIDANNKSQTLNRKTNQVKKFIEAANMLELKDKRTAENVKRCNTKSKLPINGNDIMSSFDVKGPIVGAALEYVKEEFDKDSSLTKGQCMSLCREFIQKIN